MKEMSFRLGQMCINLLGVSFFAFFLTYLAPGNPASAMYESAGIIPTPEQLAIAEEAMGLNRPFGVQYMIWLNNCLSGDFGVSFSKNTEVLSLLEHRLEATFYLAFLAMIFMFLIALPTGIFSALCKDKFPDKIIGVFNFLGVSIPSFWLGVMLFYIFAVYLDWMPVMQVGFSMDRVILPAITLAIPMSAKYSRQVRTALLEELKQDYVIGAKARGLSFKKVLVFHVLPNTILPLITMFGLSFGSLLGGTAVIEVVFSYPGLGSLMVDAVSARDYPLIQALVLWIAMVYMLLNLLVDLSYYVIDPRTKERSKT